MAEMRPLKDIFANIEQLAEKRVKLGANGIGETAAAECQCEDGHALYFKWTPQGRKMAVCQHCHPRLNCKKCGGSGHLKTFNTQTLLDDIYPNACECMRIEKNVALFNETGMPDRYLDASFGHLKFPHMNAAQSGKYMKAQEAVYNFCTSVRNAFEKHDPSQCDKVFLLLMGPVGTGKTHLACAGLKMLSLQFGISTKFIDFQAMLGKLREAYARKSSEEDILNPLRHADVLLIDEFGKGRTENEWQMEKLDDLVNSRYNARKITIATTNYLTPELMKDWHKSLSPDDKKTYLTQYNPSNSQSFYVADNKPTSSASESFWTQSLPERIGARMYDRMMEEALVVDFIGLTSFRSQAAHDFLKSLNS